MALLPAIREARCHTRHLYNLQARAVKARGWDLGTKVALSMAQKTELRWWLTFLRKKRERPLPGQFSSYELKFVASDASDLAIAMVILSHPHRPVYSRRLLEHEIRHSINYREMLAVRDGVLFFKDKLRNSIVNVRSDNSTVVAALNRWGSSSPLINVLIDQIHRICLGLHIDLNATYTPTESNIVADRASRLLPIRPEHRKMMALLLLHQIQDVSHTSTWITPQGVLQALCRTLRVRPKWNILTGTSVRTRRRMATTEVTPTHLILQDTRRTAFAFPAIDQITQFLRLIQVTRITVLVILPLFPASPWWRTVCHLAVSPPALIASAPFASRCQIHRSANSWQWIGVLLSGKRSKRLAFRRRFSSNDSHLLPLLCIPKGGDESAKLTQPSRDVLKLFMKKAVSARH